MQGLDDFISDLDVLVKQSEDKKNYLALPDYTNEFNRLFKKATEFEINTDGIDPLEEEERLDYTRDQYFIDQYTSKLLKLHMKSKQLLGRAVNKKSDVGSR